MDSFAPTNFSHHGIYVKGLRREAKSLRMSNQFDVSRPVFDLLALRTVRGDALIRYDALNQSEPLRITLYTLLAMSCFAVPSLSQAVGYDELSLPATVGSYAVGFSSVGLLVRECTRRSRQLTRIEKELNTETLPIRLPTNILADVPYTRPTTLKDLRNLSNPPRIIAISGTKAKLDQALVGLSVFGRRLQQATVYVVIVPTDGSKISELTIPATSSSIPWLADASNQIVWQEYFQSLTSDRKGSANQMASFQWFGLNSSGRSFGSGEEEIPLWLQLLGQHLRPTEILGDADDSFPNADPMLLESVASFYGSLTTGDFKGIGTIFSSNESPQVSEVSIRIF